MIRSLALSLTTLGLLALAHVVPAHAAQKVWVAYYGVDSPTCGSTSSPCRTFQLAVFNVNAGGEVGVLVPGDYGGDNGLAINKSVSITNDGTGEATVFAPSGPPNGLSIDVFAGAGDVIALRGLIIDGSLGGELGIVDGQASAVHIQNCVIRNFEFGNPFGIVFNPTVRSQLFVSDTIIFNNGSTAFTGGILIQSQNASASANVVLDRVHLENNVDGLLIDGTGASGPGTHVVVRDSVMSGNVANGIHAVTIAGKSPAFVLVEHSTMVNNGQSGILTDGPGATVLLKESTITRNGTGVSAVNGGQLFSYGNNTNNNNLGAEGTATGFLSAF